MTEYEKAIKIARHIFRQLIYQRAKKSYYYGYAVKCDFRLFDFDSFVAWTCTIDIKQPQIQVCLYELMEWCRDVVRDMNEGEKTGQGEEYGRFTVYNDLTISMPLPAGIDKFDDEPITFYGFGTVRYYFRKIDQFLTPFITIDSSSQEKPKPKEPVYDSLIDAFKEVSEYNKVMDYLMDQEYCSITGQWQDQKKGSLRFLAALIKKIAAMGYCKKDMLTMKEIKSIAKLTFKIDISQSTVEHAKPTDLDNTISLPPPNVN